MPTPRRLADNQVLDANGYPLPQLALKLGVGNVASVTAAASSAATALPGNGAPPAAGNVYLLLAAGPMAIAFGLAGMGAAVADSTSFLIPAAGAYLLDIGLTATHFRHIQYGAAVANFQLIAIPTQA